MQDYRFKVNLGGMIEILSDHFYSIHNVYIREILQNGVDAITGRKQIDGFTLHKNETGMLNRNIMTLIEKGLNV